MNHVRRDLVAGATSLAGRDAMVSATLAFERALWLLRRLLAQPAGAAGDDLALTTPGTL
jgi:hypothetical protein